MKNNFNKLAALIIATSPVALFGAITINFSGVSFLNSNGDALPDGALVQIIASTADATFSDPTPISFVSGDDRVIASFSINSATAGVPGGIVTGLNVPNYSTFAGLTPGDALLLRWFPSLTTGSSVPGATTYGQYSTTQQLDGSNISWAAPADAGGTFTLSVISSDFGGSVPVSTMRATLSTAPIPEPSAFAAFAGLFAVGFAVSRRRRFV